MISLKYRIYPRKQEVAFLESILLGASSLYNSALEHRIKAYKKGKSLYYRDQSNELKAIRESLPEYKTWSFSSQQQVLRKLDKSFKAFFSRIKKGQTPWFPRFKASKKYNSLAFVFGDGCGIKGNTLHLSGCPAKIKIKLHREIVGKPKQVVVTRHNGKWYICVQADYIPPKTSPTVDAPIGIDLGLTNLISCSDGFQVKTPQWVKG